MLNFENSLTNYQLKGASGQWIASWINSKEKKKVENKVELHGDQRERE